MKCIELNTHTHIRTSKTGQLNNTGKFYQCQHLSRAVILPSCKMVPLREMIKCTQDFSMLFLKAACEATEAASRFHIHHMLQNFTFTYVHSLISARGAILPSASLCFPIPGESYR